MNWNPSEWTWPRRLAAEGNRLSQKLLAALTAAWRKLRAIDRRDLRIFWARTKTYLKSYYFTALVLLAIVLAGPWYDLLTTIRHSLSDLLASAPAVGANGTPDVRGHYYAVGILIAALAALVTAPLTLLKAYINERQTDAAEQGLITDRFTKAVEQLGAEKTVKYLRRKVSYIPRKDASPQGPDEWIETTQREGNPAGIPEDAIDVREGAWETVGETVPNLEVRLGAIYALERIAQDSQRDHIPIMETLCAYIRENAPGREAQDHGLGEWQPLPDGASEEDRAAHLQRRQARFGLNPSESKARIWAQALGAPRADIQAALMVIGRRPPEHIAHERRQQGRRSGGAGFRLDLRGANLQRADLMGLDLARALLTGTRLEGANLGQARLEAADLGQARLEAADLGQARLDGADLRQARLEAANLWHTRLEGADLRQARLDRAYLVGAQLDSAYLEEAHLDGAAFVGARLDGAFLWKARLDGANLIEAQMFAANLIEARLGGAHLERARIDGTKLNSASLTSANIEAATCARTSLRSADLSGAKNLTQDHVNSAWGDSATILPDGIVMPDHWDDEAIGPWHDDPKYQAWLDAGAPPGEPRTVG